MIGNLRRNEGIWYITIASGDVECPSTNKGLIREFVEMYYKFEHAAVRAHISHVLKAHGFNHDLSEG